MSLSKNDQAQIGKAINNEVDLILFLKKMGKFNEHFCSLMFDRIDSANAAKTTAGIVNASAIPKETAGSAASGLCVSPQ